MVHLRDEKIAKRAQGSPEKLFTVLMAMTVVFVGVLIGVALGSIILAFLAVPILSTVTIVGGYIVAKIAQREPFPGETLPDPPEAGFFSQLLIKSPTGKDS